MAARRNTEKPAESETVLEHLEEICGRCWPNGWPHLSHSASCEHGTYVRDAAPEADGSHATETKVATADTKPDTGSAKQAADNTEKAEDQP